RLPATLAKSLGTTGSQRLLSQSRQSRTRRRVVWNSLYLDHHSVASWPGLGTSRSLITRHRSRAAARRERPGRSAGRTPTRALSGGWGGLCGFGGLCGCLCFGLLLGRRPADRPLVAHQVMLDMQALGERAGCGCVVTARDVDVDRARLRIIELHLDLANVDGGGHGVSS